MGSGPRRIATGVVALMASLAVAAAPPAGAAPPMGGGSITGQLTDSGGTPLPGVCVQVQNGPSTTTDTSGDYTFAGMVSGDYLISYDDCVNHAYIEQWYQGRVDSTTADQVHVDDGLTTTLATITMVAGATISGTATRAGTGAPLGGLCVTADVPTSGGFDSVGGTTTAADGTYTVAQIPALPVRVLFADCGTGTDVPMWNGGVFGFNDAPFINLNAGDHVTGVDAQLLAGSAVSGTVTDGSGNPLADIDVNVNASGGGASGWALTDALGHYQTEPVPPASYKVQFSDSASPAVWATNYWNGQPSQEQADQLTVRATDPPIRTGIDSVLSVGATVRGTVTAIGGSPAGDVCVSAYSGAAPHPNDVGDTTTASDGTYVLSGLPAFDVRLDFADCGSPQTHLAQWWSGASSYDAAATISLTPGATVTGVDVTLGLAGSITGTVTDSLGQPVPNVCAQASRPDGTGGVVTDTDSNGDYVLGVPAGDYRVQFIDCADPAHYAGQWYPGSPTSAGAQLVTVAAGQATSGIDAVLSTGATGRISGKVVNRHGVGMSDACVLIFVPDQFGFAAAIAADGSYSVPVPSGTYVVIFLQCSHTGGDPSPYVPDPENANIVYHGAFWNGPPVVLPVANERIDPVAEGATPISVSPGQTVTGIDHCFGCVAVSISSITPGPGSLTVAFTASQAPLVSFSSSAQTADIVYRATCTSSDGGASGSASGAGSPITVSGLSPGAHYTCGVVAADQVSIIGTSPISAPTVVEDTSSSVPPTTGVTTTTTPGAPASNPPIELADRLAMTGSSLTQPLTSAGLLLVLLGATLVLAERRRQRPLARKGSDS